MRTDDFSYDLPQAAIAQEAVEPRDASRLLLASTLEDVAFSDLPTLLAPGDLLVVNRTRVRAARLVGTRTPGGGSTEILLTQRIDDDRWRALVRPAAKLHAGQVVTCGDIDISLLTAPREGVAIVTLSAEGGNVDAAIERNGSVPLPPYFTGTLDDDNRYQTIFASATGSSAAPTAALHFTDALVRELHKGGVRLATVELDVGLDTFRPMLGETVEEHRIHTERIRVDHEAVEAVDRTRRDQGRVIAVGTTVVRTLESAAVGDGRIRSLDEPTALFITPGYRPQVIDAVITNFHAPRTTLLVLIAALIGDRWKAVYDHALARGLRFLSFGDAMFFEVDR